MTPVGARVRNRVGEDASRKYSAEAGAHGPLRRRGCHTVVVVPGVARRITPADVVVIRVGLLRVLGKQSAPHRPSVSGPSAVTEARVAGVAHVCCYELVLAVATAPATWL